MEEAKAARIDAACQAEISNNANRSPKYGEFTTLAPISYTAALEALAAQRAESPAVLAEALRQQIRVRLQVRGIKASALPYVGAKPGASEEDEAARLRTAFAGLVQSALPARPGALPREGRCYSAFGPRGAARRRPHAGDFKCLEGARPSAQR